MTCHYDGVLNVTKQGIQPCCANLHRCIFSGVIYLGKVTVKGSPAKNVVKIRLDDKNGLTIGACPFCRASVQEVSE